jgi:hypothetical protein
MMATDGQNHIDGDAHGDDDIVTAPAHATEKSDADVTEPSSAAPAPDVFDVDPEPVPQIEVSSTEVAPTEDDLQVPTAAVVSVPDEAEDGESDEDPAVLRIGAGPAADVVPKKRGSRAVPVGSRGGWWTIPTLCAGLAIVACSLIIPQTDANRRLVWERQKLERDLESIQRQVEVNEEFLDRVADDANLAERLAQRQMKLYRQGTAVLNLKHSPKDEMSPFLLTAIVPPTPLPPYESHGGILSGVFLNPRKSLYSTGVGLMLLAVGLVMGGESRAKDVKDV